MILTTFFNDKFRPLAELTVPVMVKWAQRMGYDFYLPGRVQCKDAYWSKTHHLTSLLEREKQDILWMDVDCLIHGVGEFDLGKVDPGKINIGTDRHGICCGLMLLPWNDFVLERMKEWLFCGQMNKELTSTKKHDQCTLKHLMANFAPWENAIHPMPGLMSDPDGEVPGSLVYHAWATGHSFENAVNEIRRRLKA